MIVTETIRPVPQPQSTDDSLTELCRAMRGKSVKQIAVILGNAMRQSEWRLNGGVELFAEAIHRLNQRQ